MAATANRIELPLSQEQSNAFHALGGYDDTRDRFGGISRVIYGGQAGGGKSFLICLWLDAMAKNFPGTRYYLSRERLKDIKESVLLTFWDVVKITGSKVRFNDNKNHITYSNGSQIFLIECFYYPSDPNFDSMGSREYTAGAIEEGITVVERAADILLSRTRYKHDVYGLTPKQLITCNPGDGWIKDKIVMPSLEGMPMQYNEIFVRATLDSNPNQAFRERYKKTLEENLSEFDMARLLHGDWNAKPKTGAEFLKDFSIEKHTGETLYDPRLPLHVAFDENVHPYITCLVFQIHKEGHTRVITQLDEICQAPPVNTRKHVCRTIEQKYFTHIGGMFIYGDSTSQKNDTAKEYGENFFTDIMFHLQRFHPSLRVPPANPPVASKGGFINRIMEREYKQLRILVDRRCKLSISDYAYTLEDADGGILKKRVQDPFTQISYEKHGHHVDALSYFVCEAFLSEFNDYLSGDVPPSYEVGTDRDYKFNR